MTLTRDYLSVTRRLIVTLGANATPRDNRVALGLYLLVCRMYLVEQRPIPLSRGDVRRFDPSLNEGAVKRALDRLVEGGWFLKEVGCKNSYRPTWGIGPRNRVTHPWQIGQPLLGCPTWVAYDAIRVERTILDVFLGRLRPGEPALVERYVSAPLLGLADVGAYLVALAGLPLSAQSARPLQEWELWRDGQARRVPALTRVLALVSQQALTGGPELTEAGWRKLGCPRVADPAPEGSSTSAPLLFVPKERIGSLIGALDGSLIPTPIKNTDHDDRQPAPSPRHEPRPPTNATSMRGSHEDSRDSREPDPPAGGCGLRQPIEEIPTASAQLLRALGCYPASVKKLAHLPADVVQRTIQYAEQHPRIENPAAWVVDALGCVARGEWQIPEAVGPDRERWGTSQAERTLAQYGDLFRLGSDVSDLELSAPVIPAPTPAEPTATRSRGRAVPPAPARPAPVSPPGAPPAPASSSPPATAAAVSPPGAPAQAGPPADHDVALSRQVRVQLRAQCHAAYQRTIDQLQIRVCGEVTEVRCGSLSDRAVVRDILAGVLRRVLGELGQPERLEFVVVAPKATPAAQPPDLRRSRWPA